METKQSKTHGQNHYRQTFHSIGRYPQPGPSHEPWTSTYLRDFSRLKPTATRPARTSLANPQSSLPQIQKPLLPREAAHAVEPKGCSGPRESDSPAPELKTDCAASQKRIEKIFSTNKEYFAHVLKNCLCGICTCGQCRCTYSRELRIPVRDGTKNSVYRDDFNWKTPLDHQRAKRPVEYVPNYSYKQNDTVYRNDFRPADPSSVVLRQDFMPPLKREDQEACTRHLQAPFPSASVYKENYLDWENHAKPMIIAAPAEMTTDQRFPFFGKTSNREYGAFSPDQIQKPFDASVFGQQQFKNPIGPEVDVPHCTVHQNTFQPPKHLDHGQRKKGGPRGSLVGGNPVFMNQFRTSSMSHDQGRPTICPARQILLNTRKLPQQLGEAQAN